MEKNDLRFHLLCDYLNELQTIKGLSPLNIEQKNAAYNRYVSAVTTRWIDIFSEGPTMKLIGFLLIGYPPNCHPDADFYIEEAYVAPEYRRKHHMSNAVSKFIQENEGVYCLFILKNNFPALRFWPRVFRKHGYAPCHLSDVGAGDEYCTQYGFKNVNV